MVVDSVASKENVYPQEHTPLLSQYIKSVFDSLDPNLASLARRAIGTTFHPEKNQSVTALATNSIREQWKVLSTKDPEISKRFRKWGIGAQIDSIKQQDVNLSSSSELGDAYILRNLESIIAFAKSENLDFLLGRYSGDELMAFFIPKEYVDAKEIESKFAKWNEEFFNTDHPINHELQKILPILKETHGPSTRLGANIKATNLSELKFNKQKDLRERQLLGECIDATEGKLEPGIDPLVEELINAWSIERHIENMTNEVQWLKTVLPSSIYEMYLEAIQHGVNQGKAMAYAEDATFEGMFPRLTVYRMEVFEEIVMELSKKEDLILVQDSDPYIKWTNKNVSHKAGDNRILGLREVTRPTIRHTFQSNASLIHAIPLSEYKAFELAMGELVEHQVEPKLNKDDHNPKPYHVVTSKIYHENEWINPTVTSKTTPEELWTMVDELRSQQTWNEFATVLSQIGVAPEALSNLTNILTNRINRIDLALEVVSSLLSLGRISEDNVEEALKAMVEAESQYSQPRPQS